MGIAYFIIALFILLALDFAIGRKLHLKKLNQINFPKRQCQLGIFTHGPDLFEDYFAELEKAKKHIHILFYIVKEDRFSQEFMSILRKKVQEGVEVRLLVDWVGCYISRKTIKKLKADGIMFAYSHVPKFPFLFYTSQVRNHRKITVIDGKLGFCGGFNVGKEYINKDKKLTPWRDYHLKVTGDGVRDLQELFLIDWKSATKTNLLQNEIYFPPLKKRETKLHFIPSEGNQLETQLYKVISKAKRAIFIGTPYFIPSKRIYNELLQALDRGISITILVPMKADHFLVKEASYPYLRRLIKQGANVYQYKKGFYHAKILLVDDALCDVGTANFDKRSMFLNLELNCMIEDPEFIKEVQRILRQDIQDSEKVRLSSLNSFNPFRSLKEKAAQTVSYFL